jgi:transcriptional regulator with XRE-family HTH domain
MPTQFEKFLEQQLEDPEVREAYEDASQRHDLLRTLVAERKARHITQVEVACRMNVTQPTVSGFETEESDPHLSTLQRYARAIGVTLRFDVLPTHHSVVHSHGVFVSSPSHGSSYVSPSARWEEQDAHGDSGETRDHAECVA